MLRRLRSLLVLLLFLLVTTTILQAQGTLDNVWYAEIYPERFFAGTPVKQTYHGTHLRQYWGFGKPHAAIPADYFSSRYRHYLTLDRPMRYRFVTRGDDGYRIFVDGNVILDQLSGVPLSRHIVEVDLSSGRHAIYVEHYEMVGNASLDIQLYSVHEIAPPATPTLQPSPTTRPSPVPTSVPTATPIPLPTTPPVDANAPIVIESFSVAPNPAVQGGAVTVSWNIRNATLVDVVNFVPRGRHTEPVTIYVGPENVRSVSYTLDSSDVTGAAQFELRASNNVDTQTMTFSLPFDCTLRWFFKMDHAAESAYGCPTQAAQPKQISEQRFERGWMVLFDEIAGSDSVLVFIEGGGIRIFPLEASADPDPTLDPPAGLYQPAGQFSGTWQRYKLQTELGWAVTPLETTVDTFWQGTALGDSFFYMFGSAESDTIWIIDQRGFAWLRYQPK